jgi:hypothetical protein
MRTLLLSAFLLIPAQVALQPGIVSGQLQPKNGAGVVAGVRVGAVPVTEDEGRISGASTIVSSTTTDTAGRFRLDNIPPGRYYITAGFVDNPTYYPGVSALKDATVVTVTSNATIRNLDFVIVSGTGVMVSGKVIKPQGVTLSAARVSLSGTTSTPQSVAVDPDGSFVFSRVGPGTYSLFMAGGTMAQPVSFTVGDKDVSGIEVTLVRTVTVSGILAIDGGGPRPGFALLFANFRGVALNLPAVNLRNETFETQLPEGEYRVSWNALPPGYFIKAITSGPLDLLSRALTVAADSPPPRIVVTLGVASPPPWVKVSGKVTGAPQGAGLSMNGTGAGAAGLTTTINPDGSFEVLLLPGTYQVRFTPVLPIPTVSLVVPNKDVTDAQIVFPPLVELKGHVEGPGIVTFLLFNVISPSGSRVGTAATAQADGSFKLTLPEGEWRLTLTASGFTLKSMTYGTTDLLKDSINIRAGSTQELRVTLAP